VTVGRKVRVGRSYMALSWMLGAGLLPALLGIGRHFAHPFERVATLCNLSVSPAPIAELEKKLTEGQMKGLCVVFKAWEYLQTAVDMFSCLH
jgi:hypothetical protein